MTPQMDATGNRIALLRNVAAMTTLAETVVGQDLGLPRIGVFHGYSGYGKTQAAIYAANVYRAHILQMKSVWRPKKLCQELAKEMGITPAKSIADIVDQITEALARSDRPLFIDEADYLVTYQMVEIVRDIYEGSGAAIVLIGEERLPEKLAKWERFHGRVANWVAAEPARIEDVGLLAPLYCPDIELDDAVQDTILRASHHSIRRVSNNLQRARQHALSLGLPRLTAEECDSGIFFTGRAPGPRKELQP